MILKIIVALLVITFVFLAFKHFAHGAPTTIEAEDMDHTGGKPVTDGWALMGEGTLSTVHTFKIHAAHLDIIARGDFAGDAWPLMEFWIGDVLYDTIEVDSVTWKTFGIDAQLSPGTHPIKISFINDFYEGTPETDRNFYLNKIIITEITGQPVTLTWDANQESQLKGYKLHYGKISRKAATGLIEAWCAKHEPNNADCVAEWEKICDDNGQPDPSCHPMLFQYDHVVDVRNVTQYTLIGLEEGAKYYFGCTAYDADGNGSAYSIEIDHTFEFSKPGKPGQLEKRDPVKLQFVDELFPTIKELEKAAEEK